MELGAVCIDWDHQSCSSDMWTSRPGQGGEVHPMTTIQGDVMKAMKEVPVGIEQSSTGKTRTSSQRLEVSALWVLLDGTPRAERTGKGTGQKDPHQPVSRWVCRASWFLLSWFLISIVKKNRWCPSLRKTDSPSLITQVVLRVDKLYTHTKKKGKKHYRRPLTYEASTYNFSVLQC